MVLMRATQAEILYIRNGIRDSTNAPNTLQKDQLMTPVLVMSSLKNPYLLENSSRR